jgi:hypothetical protein
VPASAQPAAAPAAGAQTSEEVRQVREELERLKQEIDTLRQDYERRIGALEGRLGALAGGAEAAPPSAVPAPVPQAPPPPPAPPVYATASKVFNPDISVIGNFLGVAGRNEHSEQPPLELGEVEAAFQAIVDPYARADFFLAASPEGVEIEEGFVTFNTLPAGLLLKAGKMRAQFGKVNVIHTHLLPWSDRPLVTQHLLGGEEGLSDAGVSLSKLIPNEALFLEATGEVFGGASEVFQSDRRSRLTYVGRLRGYRDLTEEMNLDVGLSAARGPTDLGPDHHKRLIGVDATFRWRPLRRAIYRRVLGRAELVWSRQDLPFGVVPGAEGTAKAFGFYASGDYQFSRRWFAGVRIDRSGRALDGAQRDRGAAASLTFWPSEYSLIRGQYRRTTYAEGITANELLFQLNFSIGAHGAHVF